MIAFKHWEADRYVDFINLWRYSLLLKQAQWFRYFKVLFLIHIFLWNLWGNIINRYTTVFCYNTGPPVQGEDTGSSPDTRVQGQVALICGRHCVYTFHDLQQFSRFQGYLWDHWIDFWICCFELSVIHGCWFVGVFPLGKKCWNS